jgi:hypothetical protein
LIWNACCDSERPRLDALAQRLRPKATWNDFVLPATETNLLRQISAQVRQRSMVYDELGFARKMNRGFGISALFAGDSGTGKTMAAEVIATELDLPMYRIDLSQVVNKYIGETEKNLRRLRDPSDVSAPSYLGRAVTSRRRVETRGGRCRSLPTIRSTMFRSPTASWREGDTGFLPETPPWCTRRDTPSSSPVSSPWPARPTSRKMR